MRGGEAPWRHSPRRAGSARLRGSLLNSGDPVRVEPGASTSSASRAGHRARASAKCKKRPEKKFSALLGPSGYWEIGKEISPMRHAWAGLPTGPSGLGLRGETHVAFVDQRSSVHRWRRPRLAEAREGEAKPAISVVVPTLNEALNLAHAVRRIGRALRGVHHEILVVDDASIDGTAAIADDLAAAPASNVLVIHRPGAARGLSAAILAGFAAARGDAVAVIDADLQHDPSVLPRLLSAL